MLPVGELVDFPAGLLLEPFDPATVTVTWRQPDAG
jgi:hypothetical protein